MARKAKAPAAPISDAVDIDDLLGRFKDYPAIALINRQLHAPGSGLALPILLVDEAADSCINSDHMHRLKRGAVNCHLCKRPARKWYVRFVNTTQEGRWGRIRASGFVPVLISELMDLNDISDLVKQADNYVRHGDTGREIMVKMPLELFNGIRRRKLEEQRRRAGNPAIVQKELAEAAGAELGDEAGTMLNDGGIKVERWKEDKSTFGTEYAADAADAAETPEGSDA